MQNLTMDIKHTHMNIVMTKESTRDITLNIEDEVVSEVVEIDIRKVYLVVKLVFKTLRVIYYVFTGFIEVVLVFPTVVK
jgi:hypothetical protein